MKKRDITWDQDYLETLKELVEQGEKVSLKISGWSMNPFLRHQKDYIYFEKPRFPLKEGDMVFYQRDNGTFAMHRIYRKNKNNMFDLLGDGQLVVEPGIRREEIFAVVTAVKKNGKWIRGNRLQWKFYQYLWPKLFPVRRWLFQVLNCISLHKSRKEES